MSHAFTKAHLEEFKNVADLGNYFKPKATPTVDLRKLFMHESNMQSDAHNTTGGGFGAIGLGQIRKPALDDWNQYHPNQQYTQQDLYHQEPNYNVANWYVNQRIPQQLKAYGVPDTEINRVAAYHSGAKGVANGHMPFDYVKGYMSAGMNDNGGQAPYVGAKT